MATLLLRPERLSRAAALGDFLSRFDAHAVLLTCFSGGEVRQFAQWASLGGLADVLSWCRTADPVGFARAWEAGCSGTGEESLTEPAGEVLDLRPFTDETLLRHFVRRVACRGALLSYVTEDYKVEAFWRWRDRPGRVWVQQTWQARQSTRLSCPIWANLPLGPGSLCPVTAPAVIRYVSHQHRLEAARLGELFTWTPDFIKQSSNLR